MEKADLVSKYNIPAPRYTSYPTVPYWENNLEEDEWTAHVKRSFAINNEDGISLYIHLPFCESLCTYCACNTRITVNHKVERPYIDAVIKEWQLYLKQFGAKPLIKEIHLGGGTPTFFTPENLYLLINSILQNCDIAKDHDFSFEGHPSNTTSEHLQTLFDLGFKRVSFGVQDFNEKVQDTINRYQSFEQVRSVMETARKMGYTSINVDLIYGLPYQTLDTVNDTIQSVITLRPERIAFYSYAHVPWLKPGQRKYTDKDLPEDAVKRKLYERGRDLFLEAGYYDVGMDHFALPNDELVKAYHRGALHRNFMGYTTNTTKLLIALGCSSISDTWTAFAQNIKTVEEYQKAVEDGKFPVHRGHVLTDEDLKIRAHILNLMCRNETDLETSPLNSIVKEKIIERLQELLADELISVQNDRIKLTDQGKLFLRNICLALDERYWNKIPEKNTFSSTA